MAEVTGLLQEAPPTVINALEAAAILDGQSVLLSTATDLDAAGEPAAEWLIVTREWIAVVKETREIVHELRIADAESFRAYSAVGSGFLQAQIDGAWIDLLRYSKALSPRFGRIAKKLDELKKNGEVEIDPDEVAVERCRTCGAKLRYAGELCLKCIDQRAVVKRVWELIHPFRWPTAALLVLLVLGILISLVPPKLQQYLVDNVLTAPDRAPTEEFLGSLGAIVLGLALTRVIGSAVGQLKGMISFRIGTGLTFRLRSRLVDKLQDLPIGFYDKNQVGMLSARVTGDTEALHGFIQQLTSGFLLQLFQFLGVGVMLFVLNPELALYTLAPAPLVLAGSIVFWRFVHPKYFRYYDSIAKQVSSLFGMLSGIRVVKAFAQEEREIARFGGVSSYVRNSRLDIGDSAITYATVMSLIFSLGGLIVWYVGGKDVIAARMSLGSLIAFLAYLSMFYAPLSTLAQLTTWLSSFVASSARVLELLDTPSEMTDPEEPKKLGAKIERISFEDVTFGYDRHQPVLESVSFEIPEPQMIGIVGRSGSGKTTMVNLLCRFYDVQAGRVAIDGIDVRDLARRELRNRIGIVLQETFLFRGTVWENLIYGHAEATVEQVLTAAKAAHAHEFIMKMPFGYDTAVGERGANLSGGERQRLAIARALVYDPSILILDEATSNLDTESERSIQDALEQIARGRTTIMIAHRLSTLRHASRILVFDRGQLVEDGSHLELLAKDGIYAKLIKMQSRLSIDAPIDVHAAVREDKPPESSAYLPRWLTGRDARISRGPRGELVVTIGGETHGGAVALHAFPTQPGRWICLRHARGSAAEAEIGIIRDLAEWDAGSRSLIEEALSRRYHLNVIEGIEHIELAVGILTLRVRTRRGPAELMMRWTQNQTLDYGKRGKVLTDLDDNQWLIPDVEALPKREQWLFRRFVYW